MFITASRGPTVLLQEAILNLLVEVAVKVGE